jgi:FkbM family methyltransferase
MEPDPKTFKKLCNEFEGETEIEFLPFNFGLSDTEKELSFRGDGGRGGSSAVEKGNKTARFKSLDSIIGDGHVDYIKYDVEGFEYEALIGSEKTIRRERPCMLVSLYHRSEDLFKLPLKVKELLPDSKLYLRRLSGIPAWDINLLVVPKKDN